MSEHGETPTARPETQNVAENSFDASRSVPHYSSVTTAHAPPELMSIHMRAGLCPHRLRGIPFVAIPAGSNRSSRGRPVGKDGRSRVAAEIFARVSPPNRENVTSSPRCSRPPSKIQVTYNAPPGASAHARVPVDRNSEYAILSIRRDELVARW